MRSANDYIADAMSVHRKAKRGLVYTLDKGEHWELPPDISAINDDCDGFAIACADELRRLGHPARLVFCSTEEGNLHLVCTVGKYVLDNRRRRVYLMTTGIKRGYYFAGCSGTSPGEPWRKMIFND